MKFLLRVFVLLFLWPAANAFAGAVEVNCSVKAGGVVWGSPGACYADIQSVATNTCGLQPDQNVTVSQQEEQHFEDASALYWRYTWTYSRPNCGVVERVGKSCKPGYFYDYSLHDCVKGDPPQENPCPPTGPSIDGGAVAYEGRGSVSGTSGSLCFGGCEVSFREETQMGLCITIGSQGGKKGCTLETVSRLDRTGNKCEGGGAVERTFLPTINTLTTESGESFSLTPNPPTNCVTGNGKSICVETDPDKDCGTVNGEEICVPKPQRNNANSTKPDKVCIDFEGKAYCASREKSPATDSPPAPAGSPTAQVTAAKPGENGTNGNATGTTINVYNGTSSGSSSGGSGGGSGSGGTSGGPTPEEGGNCGGTGQPVCKVKIDETGVPSAPSAISTAARDAAIDAIGATAVTELNKPTPIEGSAFTSLRELLPTFSTGQCRSISSGVIWAGKSFTFPGVKGCEAFETLKVWEGYFLILYTIYACMLRAISGTKPRE